MSFLKKLFGGSGGQPSAAGEPSVADSRDYAGFTIKATPMPEGAQFRLAALIEKEIGGETRSHRMIRADLFSSKDEAAQFAFRKAEQMIDEQGEAIFQS
ncbi:hypothetical protein E3C22_15925 [Jiella endophytica]|uniref:Transcriptional activator HlyU n=1 Tax=Jiella endophytica TaxID=2558362 RepID=A0A4Y8RDN9_9HYPH|nr:HlyU family transcriptional regulator [Jiella endophytica]TFF20405.1 hypothetical protein E3C22_15925 [Jiella endophytica]